VGRYDVRLKNLGNSVSKLVRQCHTFFTFNKFVKRGESNLGTKLTEHYLSVCITKKLGIVENNQIGRKTNQNCN